MYRTRTGARVSPRNEKVFLAITAIAAELLLRAIHTCAAEQAELTLTMAWYGIAEGSLLFRIVTSGGGASWCFVAR